MSKRRSSSRKRSLPTEPLCLEGPSDIAMRVADHGDVPSPHHDTKAWQLCGQVAEALRFALAGCGDPRLFDLVVEAVVPAPSASRLRVVVSAEAGVDAVATLEALERARGYLRQQVAGSIHRKRTPELSFALAPARFEEGGEP